MDAQRKREPADYTDVSAKNDVLVEPAVALAALRALPHATVLVFDRDLRVMLAAGEALDRHGSTVEAMEGCLAADTIPAERWRLYEPLCRAALQGRRGSVVVDVPTPEGSFWYEVEVGPMRSTDGIDAGVLIARDITALEEAKAELREAQELFSLAFEHAPIGMALTESTGHWVRINRSFCELVGYTEAELLQTTFAAITHPDDRATDQEDVARLLAGEQSVSQAEKRYIHRDGHVVWINRSLSLVRDAAGAAVRFIVQVQDESERRAMEERLRHQADHDPLTGLVNRRRFNEALRDQIGRCRRYGERAALLMIDLDEFKQINDAFGHQAGDDVLRAVGDTLRARLRPSDTVARLGGDEFAVVLVHVGRPRAKAIVGELRELIGALRVVSGAGVATPRASIGMAFMEAGVADDEATLAEADLAMYAMKRASRGLAA